MSNRTSYLALGLAIIALMPPRADSGARAALPRPQRAAKLASPIVVPEGGSYQYQVQPGDTLRSIADEYFVRPRDKAGYNAVLKLNGIKDSGRLKVGGRIAIPRQLLIVVPARAIVAGFRGTVSIGPNRAAKINAVVAEGARIETGANSSVSFSLEDGSIVTLPSQSVFMLERLRLVLISGELQHVFRLDRGHSEFVVSPAKGPAARFEVKTPVSVSAVRGTEFRMSVEDGGGTSIAEVLKDNVEVTGKGGGDLNLAEGYGAKTNDKGVGKPVKLLPPPDVILPVYHHPNGSLSFNIKPVAGAVLYRLQIASDLAFQDVREDSSNEKPVFGVAKAPVGSYYVKVTAIDAQGIQGLQHIYPFEYHQ